MSIDLNSFLIFLIANEYEKHLLSYNIEYSIKNENHFDGLYYYSNFIHLVVAVDTEKTLVKALLNHIRKESVKPEGKTNSLLEFNMLKKCGTGYLKDI